MESYREAQLHVLSPRKLDRKGIRLVLQELYMIGPGYKLSKCRLSEVQQFYLARFLS